MDGTAASFALTKNTSAPRRGIMRAAAVVTALAAGCAGLYLASDGSPASASVPTAQPRASVTVVPLVYANPGQSGLSGEYDLGDACLGSAVMRHVNAIGGMRPYRYTTAGTNSLRNVLGGTHTSLSMGLSGVISGVTPDEINAVSPNGRTITGAAGLHFNVTATDSYGASGQSNLGLFNLALFPANTPFRFAQDALSQGWLGEPYVSTIGALAGTQPIKFETVSVVNSAGANVTLSDLGLFLTPDGVLMGRPLQSGTFTLTARCTDAAGKVAASRKDPLVNDQVFSLTVGAQGISGDDVVTGSCHITTGSLTALDTVNYSGSVSYSGVKTAELVNTETIFRVGGLAVSARFDKKGKAVNRLDDGGVFTVKINAEKGTYQATLSGTDFATRIGLSTDLAESVRLPVEVTVGSAVTSVELLSFDVRARATVTALDYALGGRGSNPAGIFQVINVAGSDAQDLGGNPGSAWRANFICAPRVSVIDGSNLPQTFETTDAVTIRIGNNYTETTTAGALTRNGQAYHFKGLGSNGVSTFALNVQTFKGRIVTLPLPTFKTGILQAAQSAGSGQVYFPFGLDLTGTTQAGFTGGHGHRVFGAKNKFND